MEFRPEDIAVLVLGYLKDQKCKKAFHDLLSRSPHLRRHFVRHRKGQIIVTRLQGLNLINYLEEYADMYNMVQEYIESSDYYEEGGRRDRPSPVHQLRYLLSNKYPEPRSRTSTPSEHMFHERKRMKLKLPDRIDVVDNTDVNTTPAHSLPGNSSDLNCSTPSSRGKDTDDEAPSKEKSQEICKEIFTQTFLENTELIEKLADNINKEVSRKTAKEDNNLTSAIDTIIERFAQEPVIISSIEEIIGTSHNNTENEDKGNSLEKVQEALETQNKEAVLSIIEVSKQQEFNQPSRLEVVSSSNMEISQNVHVEASSTSQVDDIQQSVNNYNSITSVSNQTMTNQHLLVNSGNLLMLQPNMTPTSISLTTATKPYYVIGGQATNNVIIPQTPFKVGNVLTEQDIMTMPTIIVCDNQPSSIQPIIMPSNINLPSLQKSLPPPKMQTSSAQTLSEFVTQYSCTEAPSPAVQQHPQLESSPPIAKVKLSNKRKKKASQPPPASSNSQKPKEEASTASQPAQGQSMPTLGTPQAAPRAPQEENSRSTPRNGTHVRQLDFSTPEKWLLSVPKTSSMSKVESKIENKDTPVKTVKSIRRTSLQFTSPNEIPTSQTNAVKKSANQTQSEVKIIPKSKKADTSWDSDLRALIKPVEEPVKRSNKRKLNAEISKDNLPAKKIKESKSFNEPLQVKISICDIEKMDISADKNNATNNKVTMAESNELHVTVNPNQSLLQISEKSEIGEYDNLNRNLKSRIRKKCNVENPTRRPQHQEEVVLTNIKKIKSCEVLEDNQNKLILSPSKLNANKRTLVEIEPCEPSCSKTSQDPKFISPDEIKTFKNFPITKVNLTPVLETPVKSEVNTLFPKTPNFTSCDIDTPFTKAVLDQLTDVDINCIPTPKFPITPSIPFTPGTQSPFSNRATDYSTSSSYYQPSDNEQNKSLEQLLEECRKYDKQAENKPSVSSAEASKTPKKQPTYDQKPKENDNPSTIESTSFIDKKKAFNLNIIGKKNLQLVKMFADSVEKQSSSSSSTSASSSSDDDSDFSDVPEDAKDKEEVYTYSLRPRKSLTEVEKPPEAVKTEEPKPKKAQFQDSLLREMEQKRQRIIAKFKDPVVTTPKAVKRISQKKAEVKSKVEKKKEDKPLSKPEKTISTKSEKAKTPKTKTKRVSIDKKPLEKPKRIVKRISPRTLNKRPKRSLPTPKKKTKLAKALVTDDEQIVLHLSSETESLEPSDMVEAVLMDYSNSASAEKTTEDAKLQDDIKDKESKESDPESETAVKLKGLLQMGIHLIPNKKSTPNVSSAELLDNTNLTKTSEPIKLPEKGSGILNQSIEGELISDSENDADHQKPTKKTPLKEKLSEKEKNLSDQLRRFHERSKYKPNLISPRHAKSSNKESPQLPKEQIDLSIEKIDLFKENKNRENQNINLVTDREDVKSSPDSEYHPVTFDIVTKEKETLTISHDYSKVTSRKLSDYNLELLDKKFSANVYIAEIDSEVEKFLTFTPFEFLLELNPPLSEENSRSRKKYKPLKILQNEIIKPADEYSRPSILNNLYSPEVKNYKRNESSSKVDPTRHKPNFSSSREKEHLSERSKREKQLKDEKDCKSRTEKEKHVRDTKERQSRVEKEKQIRVEKEHQSRVDKEKTVKDEKQSERAEKQVRKEEDCKNITEKEKLVKAEKDSQSRIETEKQIEAEEDAKSRLIKDTGSVKLAKNTKSAENDVEKIDKAIQEEKIEKAVGEKLIEAEENVESMKTESSALHKVENIEDPKNKTGQESTKVEQIQSAKIEEETDKQSQNDDLMNYAIIGSVESDAESERRNEDKQKPKAEELLKNIDVDSFLKQLHGES